MISQIGRSDESIDADARLMLAVRAGSTAAFEELLKRHESPVFAFLQQRTGNRHQAEDLTQDVFLRVYRARGTYRPMARFSVWLRVIVRNVLANATRSRARSLETSVSHDNHPNPLEWCATCSIDQCPATNIELAELRRTVRLAVNSVCQRQRQAVMLQTYRHMNYERIAATMNISPQAVKSLLSRARERLRCELAPYVFDHH